MIKLENICKSFRVAKRQPGIGAAVRALFNKEYEVIHALKNVSFSVNDGEIIGYIGPNGAGKSSTVKVMSGILTPDSGECLINGICPWKDRKKHASQIGVVFGQRSQLWWDVPVIDSFELLRDIYSVDEAKFRNNLSEITEVLDIGSFLNTPVRTLSLGQRMRCEIAASLLHQPDILFLDEPTIGLDAVSKNAVREFVKKINKERGTTVILTTHDMQDIEALCDRILLIGRGQILMDGSLDELKSKVGAKRRISVIYSGENPECTNGIRLISSHPGHAEFEIDTNIIKLTDAISQMSEKTEIHDISVSGNTAEDAVISLYKELEV